MIRIELKIRMETTELMIELERMFCKGSIRGVHDHSVMFLELTNKKNRKKSIKEVFVKQITRCQISHKNVQYFLNKCRHSMVWAPDDGHGRAK